MMNTFNKSNKKIDEKALEIGEQDNLVEPEQETRTTMMKMMDWLSWRVDTSQLKLKPGLEKATMGKFRTWIVKNLLLVVTFSGVSCGVALGLCLRYSELDSRTINYIKYPGELFMRLLKLMILPLIIASLITGAASLNAKMNGMIALRTIVYFLATSLISSLIGLGLVLIIHPGDSQTKDLLGNGDTKDRMVDIVDNFMDLGRNLFPDNLFQASFQTAHTTYTEQVNNDTKTYARDLSYRSGTNTLGIIFFCLTFGTVLGSLGTKGKPVINFFSVIDDVIMKMVYGIMWLSPIGISSVICGKILDVDDLANVMSQLGLFIVTVVSGLFFYQFVVMQAIYFVFVRKNPYKFWWGMFQAWMTAFATASTQNKITDQSANQCKIEPMLKFLKDQRIFYPSTSSHVHCE